MPNPEIETVQITREEYAKLLFGRAIEVLTLLGKPIKVGEHEKPFMLEDQATIAAICKEFVTGETLSRGDGRTEDMMTAFGGIMGQLVGPPAPGMMKPGKVEINKPDWLDKELQDDEEPKA
jgi:hypothetical protein